MLGQQKGWRGDTLAAGAPQLLQNWDDGMERGRSAARQFQNPLSHTQLGECIYPTGGLIPRERNRGLIRGGRASRMAHRGIQ